MTIKTNTNVEVQASTAEQSDMTRFFTWVSYVLPRIAIIIFVGFPIFWITLSAFKQAGDVRTPSLIFQPTFGNFEILFSDIFNFGDLIKNSLIICFWVIVITIPLGVLAAYALARYPLIGKRALLVAVLATQFFPPVVLVLPYFTLFRQMNLLDTHLALIIVNLTRTLPFVIWLLKGFMDTLPLEIEEAALVDGASEFGILRYIVFPLSVPGVITSVIFTFILSWNEFLYALLLSSRESRTVIVGLVNVVGERDIPWELMSAAGILIMVPMMLLAFAIRRYFVEGLTMGAVK